MIKINKSWVAFIPALFLSFNCISISLFAQNRAETQNLEKLAVSSEIILIGNVKETVSHWNNNKTSIFTKVSISPTDFIKGRDNGSELIITVPGGEIGEIGELYTHMPRFAKDEEVLLFMKNENNHYSIIGGDVGKITLSNKEKDGRETEMSREQIKDLKNTIKSYLTE